MTAQHGAEGGVLGGVGKDLESPRGRQSSYSDPLLTENLGFPVMRL